MKKNNISFICVPIISDEEVIGTLSIDREKDGPRDLQRDSSILETAGNILADAVANIKSDLESRERLIEENERLKYELGEKYKYDKLMSLPEDVVKLYYVNDPKGSYIYWLNEIKLPKVESIRCPSTTMWSQDRKDKEVYLLPERLASLIEWSTITENDVWY